MAISSEVLNFADPNTLALFDRTPEQRASFGRHMLRLIADPDSGSKSLDIRASLEMFSEFKKNFALAVTQRAEDLHEVDLRDRQLPPYCIGDQAYMTQALDEITTEIAELHTELPLPMLDRLGAKND